MANNASPHHYSFVPDARTSEYLSMNKSYDDRASSPARKLWPFNRSRSSSPNTQAQAGLSLDTGYDALGSRRLSASPINSAISPSGSGSSFVVKSVIRASGGVSLQTSPARDQRFNSNNSRQHSSSPAAKRMTLEDSDDEGQQQQLQYRRSKSKPLGAVASLGVPPGGPGGGVGYGTARSSNDGRPESAAAYQQSPFYRPPSPSGSMTAGDFQRGTKERGRSPRKSIPDGSDSFDQSSDQRRDGSAQSAASSPGKKPVARITVGPQSLAQQQHHNHQQAHHQYQQQQQQQQQQQHAASRGPSPAAAARNAGLSGPRHFPGGPPSPSGPIYNPHTASHDASYQIQPLQHQHAPRQHSAGPTPHEQRGDLSFPLLPPQHAPGHESRDESPSRSSRFSFGFGNRSRKDSEKSVQRLDGLPSPVDIPFGRSSHSPLRFSNGEETRRGSVSPARASPNNSGFLSNLMSKSPGDREVRQQRSHDDTARSGSHDGGLAGKWFKGVFGRSPRADEKDWTNASDYTAFPLVADAPRSNDDDQAYAQKLASMRQARHIVDEERRRLMFGETAPSDGPADEREFRPRQAIDDEVEFELGRKKSPPGRKPVPAYLPAATTPTRMSASRDEPMTPAQRIIQETRSRELAREQIEAQRKQALDQQRASVNADPRQTVAARIRSNGPPTPPKGMPTPQQQRYPSGPHQITRESARSGPAAPPNQRPTLILSPGAGPMPASLPLRDALQEMMSRFYRFERYSVPLIRSLETRLLDIERDAMLASNPHARSSTTQSAEMDVWVQQMTNLMRHEVRQLDAATRELREARELVATVARGVGPGGVTVSNSVSSFGSLAAVTASTSGHVLASRPMISPVEEKKEPSTTSGADSGTRVSPTKANFGFASESRKEKYTRDRSVSPNGRPRYTSVLGQPLGQGQQERLSPDASTDEQQGGMRKVSSVEDRLKALMEGEGSRDTSYTVSPSVPQEEEPKTDPSKDDEAEMSGSSDIAAALAAIDSNSFPRPTAHQSEHSAHDVAVRKSFSHSSSHSGSASEAVEEPLTPTIEAPPSPAVETPTTHKPDASEDSLRGSILPYMRETSPVKTHFPTTLAVSPVASPGRISPTKLYAHKFAPSSPSTSAKLGLVEKKRFTLPAAPSLGSVTTVPARQGGRISRTPSYTFDDAACVNGPASAAFGVGKGRPVGHRATLQERVAFFDAGK
ncbi:hypothetical protein PSEUBRA_003626 [Kalmanozyma brasiliensis GHG001]|uniref:uncharacterized protein n=1 Tax=Kalmanozyma brasiliensis (strain GHG001) TaxID=1365824 RepID=UPI0028681581|nr:uncharacterized protein PSEUBRA_003626 [Kalmanozyma brasiliensis GHG001]EST06996.2 hypothetical protein PSEUBRA_003626 [Kalmanozyma brasiliensis GHG001]